MQTTARGIYGTRPWRIYGEGPTQVVEGSFNEAKRAPFTSRDVRFTTRGDLLYAIALAWPEDGRVLIKSLSSDAGLLNRRIAKVEIVDGSEDTADRSAAAVAWTRDASGLTIDLGGCRPGGRAVAFRITPANR